jgi:ribosomal protein S18 acetylase RimI-like enzyme
MNFDVQLRRAAQADVPFLWAMLAGAANWNGVRTVSVADLQTDDHDARYLEAWGREHDCGVIAEVNERPVGAAWYRLLPEDRSGWGFIDSTTPEIAIGVVPEFRGQGIGTRLLEALLAEATPRFEAICLSVEFENPALRLYERLGFQKVRPNGGAWTMVRQLQQ